MSGLTKPRNKKMKLVVGSKGPTVGLTKKATLPNGFTCYVPDKTNIAEESDDCDVREEEDEEEEGEEEEMRQIMENKIKITANKFKTPNTFQARNSHNNSNGSIGTFENSMNNNNQARFDLNQLAKMLNTSKLPSPIKEKRLQSTSPLNQSRFWWLISKITFKCMEASLDWYARARGKRASNANNASIIGYCYKIDSVRPRGGREMHPHRCSLPPVMN